MTDADFLAYVQSKWPSCVKVGNIGRVRLTGEALCELRGYVYLRDNGRCRETDRFVSDDLPDWHADKYHMAHIKSRGAGGSDLPSNCLCLSGAAHRAQHSGVRLKCMQGRQAPERACE